MSQATEKAAAAVPVPIVKHIAPPFMGSAFRTYRSGTSIPGYWSAIRHDVTRGGLVVQLGADPNQAPVEYGGAYAGFEYTFTVPTDPYLYYQFRAQFNPGTVTVKQTGGDMVNPYCEAFIITPGVPSDPAGKQRVYSNTPLSLGTAHFLIPGKTYTLEVSCGVWIRRVSANVPYGEVIIKDIDLQLSRYPFIAPPAFEGEKGKAAALTSGSKRIIESVNSIEEAQAKGLTGIFN